MQPERRQFVRLRTRLTTVFKIVKTGKVRRGLTKNISGVGICFVTNEMVEPGERLNEIIEPGEFLDVELQLPDCAAPITFSAAVVWLRPLGGLRKSYEIPTVEVGVKFVTIDSKDVSLLGQYAALNALPPEDSSKQ